jgi:hypothetical protein
MTFGKPIALIQVPNQRLFGPAAAARYLGISPDTLKKRTDLQEIPCFEDHGRRTYKLEDLEAHVGSLKPWVAGYDTCGEKPAKVIEEQSTT